MTSKERSYIDRQIDSAVGWGNDVTCTWTAREREKWPDAADGETQTGICAHHVSETSSICVNEKLSIRPPPPVVRQSFFDTEL